MIYYRINLKSKFDISFICMTYFPVLRQGAFCLWQPLVLSHFFTKSCSMSQGHYFSLVLVSTIKICSWLLFSYRTMPVVLGFCIKLDFSSWSCFLCRLRKYSLYSKSYEYCALSRKHHEEYTNLVELCPYSKSIDNIVLINFCC